MNPLIGINIFLYSMEEIRKQETIEGEYLNVLQNIVGQMKQAFCMIGSVIKRVMDFSKPDDPKRVSSCLNECINNAALLCSTTLSKEEVDLRFKLRADLPKCLIDKQLMEQVILNLITNSAKLNIAQRIIADHNGTIHIRL